MPGDLADTPQAEVDIGRVGRSLAHAFSGIACGIAFITLLTNAVVLIAFVPRLIEIFEEFDTDLPGLTILLIHWRYGLGVFCGVLAVALVAKELLIRPPVAKLVINLVALLGLFVLVPMTVLGLFMPLVALMQSLM